VVTRGDSERDDAPTDSARYRVIGPRLRSGVDVLRASLLRAVVREATCLRSAHRVKDELVRVRAFDNIDSDDIVRTLGVISMRALGIRSSYKGRTVDA
jgi:hypothetical protein